MERMMQRRAFLSGLLAAPMVVRASSLEYLPKRQLIIPQGLPDTMLDRMAQDLLFSARPHEEFGGLYSRYYGSGDLPVEKYYSTKSGRIAGFEWV